MNKKDAAQLESMTTELKRLMRRMYQVNNVTQSYRDEAKELKINIASLVEIKDLLDKSTEDIRNHIKILEDKAGNLQGGLSEREKEVKRLSDSIKKDKAAVAQDKRLVEKVDKAVRAEKEKYKKLSATVAVARHKLEQLCKLEETEISKLVQCNKQSEVIKSLLEAKHKSVLATEATLKAKETKLDARERDYEERQRALKDKQEAFRIEKNKFYELTKERKKK